MSKMMSRLSRRRLCPTCRSARTVPIIYGNPPTTLFEAEARGELRLGGCIRGPDDPKRACLDCGADWR